MSTEEIDNNDVTHQDLIQNIAEEIRLKRNSLLAKTDMWDLADFLATEEQLNYRQALWDVPQQNGFPTDINWPTKPE